MARRLERLVARADVLALRLAGRRPDLERAGERCARAALRLTQAGNALLARRGERLAGLGAHLQHLAPQAVLARGYSITRDEAGHILRRAEEVAPGERVSVELASGRLHATVNSSDA